jgi:hypothetical protein
VAARTEAGVHKYEPLACDEPAEVQYSPRFAWRRACRTRSTGGDVGEVLQAARADRSVSLVGDRAGEPDGGRSPMNSLEP